jgi:hypothetical protein
MLMSRSALFKPDYASKLLGEISLSKWAANAIHLLPDGAR